MNSITLNEVQETLKELTDGYVNLADAEALMGQNLISLHDTAMLVFKDMQVGIAGVTEQLNELNKDSFLRFDNNFDIVEQKNAEQIATSYNLGQSLKEMKLTTEAITLQNAQLTVQNNIVIALSNSLKTLTQQQADNANVLPVRRFTGNNTNIVSDSTIDYSNEKNEDNTNANRISKTIGEIASNPETAGPETTKFLGESFVNELSKDIRYYDNYVNEMPAQKFGIDKSTALDNIRHLNSFAGMFQLHSRDKQTIMGNGEDCMEAGAQYISLADLVKAYPKILEDQKYIDEVRRLLDIKGNQELINLARQLDSIKKMNME